MPSYLDRFDGLSRQIERMSAELPLLATRFFSKEYIVKKSRLAILRQAIARCTFWITLFIACICLCIYVVDARTRSVNGAACQWDFIPDADGIPYSARWCKLTKDTVLLRLYDVKGQHLLAERTYLQLGQPHISWARDRLWYDTYPEDAFIALPPSIFERLRARLP